ncbi:MAG: DUF1987 domain-containing protein [Flavobacteriales bacterium]|nr:DUF1987 domain-containing protein [Flavobacteriales bacterium]
MESLFLKASKNTPMVVMDVQNQCFAIMGNSLPENAAEFYEPLFTWLERHGASLPKGAEFRFRLSYFSTSSMKALFKMLAKLKELNVMHGLDVHVKWHVEDEDEFMVEAGSSLFELIDLPFSYVHESEHEGLADTLATMQRYAAQLAA